MQQSQPSWRTAKRQRTAERFGKKLPPLKPQLPKKGRRASAPAALIPIKGRTPPETTREKTPETRRKGAQKNRPAPWRSSLHESSIQSQIPRKRWKFLKRIFDEHSDGSGFITEAAFVEAVIRQDERKAEDHARHIQSKFHDADVGSTIGAMAEKAYLASPYFARRQHAQAMFYSFVDRKAQDMTATWKKRNNPEEGAKISLLDFMCLNTPHLPRDAVRKACEFYSPLPPPPPKEEKLADIEGAKEEVAQIFQALDVDGDGVVKVKNLEPLMVKLGITKKDVNDWLSELPPSLHRVEASLTPDVPPLTKMKSKLGLLDLEKIMAPVYLKIPEQPGTATSNDLEEIQKRIEWNEKIAMDVIYGGVA